MAQKKGELLVGLDIGTTKICCIVGEETPEGIDVIGIGTHPSRGLRKGRAINIPQDREILHVLPQDYIIDEQDGIKEPLGMSGVRLEAKVHIVTAAVSSAQNIVKCCAKAGLQVADIVLEPLASAEAVLAEEEKELGVALVDVGGGTTDLAIFSGGAIQHTSVIPLGGNHLTNDIAVGLRTPMVEAEKIKVKFGSAQ